MLEKPLSLCLLFTIIVVAAAQQTFHRKGEFYDAKVAIQRFKPQNIDMQRNTPLRQQLQQTSLHRPHHHGRPWRQGDRITKQEVVQNLAKALLSRKMTSEEIKNEKRKENREKLHEYALYQARLARKSSQAPLIYNNPMPEPPPQYPLPQYPPPQYPPPQYPPPQYPPPQYPHLVDNGIVHHYQGFSQQQPRLEQGTRNTEHEQQFIRQSDQLRLFAQSNPKPAGQNQQTRQTQHLPVKSREFIKSNI